MNQAAASIQPVDADRLTDWMDSQKLGEGPISNTRPLAGGSINVMLHFERSGRQYVIRRPPMHSVGNANQTMRREMRVLKALGATDVPHAGLIAGCEDESVLGAVFYLMEPVDGFNPRVVMPPLHANDPSVRHRMGLALIESLARLANVDYESVGLADFGKPEGFLERQVKRWGDQLAGYASFTGWPGPNEFTGLDEVAGWLEAHQPKTFTPGIMHGDFHLSNVMYRYESSEIAAIVDWELTTIGDPLLDLGWVLSTWPRPGTHDEPLVKPWDGFPTAQEIIDHYSKLSKRDVSNVVWYYIMACYKFAILLEGTYARACAGKASRKTGDELHRMAVQLIGRAHDALV